MSKRADVLREAYKVRMLAHFFTCSVEEVRSWPCPVGSHAPEAAGMIHCDFEASFVAVEVQSFADLSELGDEVAVKAEGKLQQHGKKYIIQDGDIAFFKFKIPQQALH